MWSARLKKEEWEKVKMKKNRQYIKECCVKNWSVVDDLIKACRIIQDMRQLYESLNERTK